MTYRHNVSFSHNTQPKIKPPKFPRLYTADRSLYDRPSCKALWTVWLLVLKFSFCSWTEPLHFVKIHQTYGYFHVPATNYHLHSSVLSYGAWWQMHVVMSNFSDLLPNSPLLYYNVDAVAITPPNLAMNRIASRLSINQSVFITVIKIDWLRQKAAQKHKCV